MMVAGLELTRIVRTPSPAKRAARLHAGIVELGGLTDDDRTGADDEDLAWHVTPSARSTARSKTRAASMGPGAPSGWNWTDAIRPLR